MIYHLEHPAPPRTSKAFLQSGCAHTDHPWLGQCIPDNAAWKFIGYFIIILGVGMFALPTGILTSGFVEELLRMQKKEANEEAGRYDEGP